MTIFDGIHPIGLGTNRLPIKSASDEEGIELSAQIVADALNAGVNYIDVSHTYSRGMAQEAVRRALRAFRGFEGVTIKTRLDLDTNIDDVRKRTYDSLNNMGLSRAKYFLFWSLFSWAEFEKIMRTGGIYDGAIKLKDEGVIGHICFSVHAPADDIVRMLRTQAFEAVTLSYSLLNSARSAEILQTAHDLNIGIAAMNPLGGGIIPNNPDYFSFAKMEEDETVSEAAVRYVLAHGEIQLALCGVSSREEVAQNVKAVPAKETGKKRIQRVDSCIASLDNFCTGCGYCNGCPVDIPVSAIMQCRNSLAFKPTDSSYNFLTNEYVKQNIYVVGKLEQEYSVLFETSDNPCVKCGQCESKCTQKLGITDAVDDTFTRADYSNFSLKSRIEKLKAVIDNSEGNIIGLYPSGITASMLLRFYRENVGELKCNIVQFDSSPLVWGKNDNGVMIYSPDEIPTIKPKVIIITSYKFKDEIYRAIKHYESNGIRIIKLYEDNDLPWLL